MQELLGGIHTLRLPGKAVRYTGLRINMNFALFLALLLSAGIVVVMAQ